MKRIASIFSLLCLFAPQIFAGALVQVPLADMQLQVVTGRVALVTCLSVPRGASGMAVVQDRRKFTSDTNGAIWITNAITGKYVIEVQGPPDTTRFAFLITATNGTINVANGYMVADAGNSLPPDSVSYGAAASDQRYVLRSETLSANGISAGTNVTIGTNTGLYTINADVGHSEVQAAQASAQAAATNYAQQLSQANTNFTLVTSNLIFLALNASAGISSAQLSAATNFVSTNLIAQVNIVSNLLWLAGNGATNDLNTALLARFGTGTNTVQTNLTAVISAATNKVSTDLITALNAASNVLWSAGVRGTNDLNTLFIATLALNTNNISTNLIAVVNAASNSIIAQINTNSGITVAQLGAATNSTSTNLIAVLNAASNVLAAAQRNGTNDLLALVASLNALNTNSVSTNLIAYFSAGTNSVSTNVLAQLNAASNILWSAGQRGTNDIFTLLNSSLAASTNSVSTNLISQINISSNLLFILGNGNLSASTNSVSTNLLAQFNAVSNIVWSAGVRGTNDLYTLLSANLGSSTNSVSTNLLAQLNAVSNIIWVAASRGTNDLAARLAGSLTTSNLYLSGNLAFTGTTNCIAVYSSGNGTNDGTYVQLATPGRWTNQINANYIVFLGPNYYLVTPDGILQYSTANPWTGPWAAVNGNLPAPSSSQGYTNDVTGRVVRGIAVDTNLDARLLGKVGTNSPAAIELTNRANQVSGILNNVTFGSPANLVSNVVRQFYVSDFGAYGTNADDTEAISNAIFFASANNLGNQTQAQPGAGSEVVFPPGKYRTTYPLLIKSTGLKLRGIGGPGQCMITNASTDIFQITNGPNDIVVEGFFLKGPGLSTSAATAINCGSSSDNTIDNLIIKSCSIYGFSNGVFWADVSNSKIYDCDISYNGTAVWGIGSVLNANRIESIASQNKITCFNIDSGDWILELKDTGGSDVGQGLITTNILKITGAPTILLRGGNSEFYGADAGHSSAAIFTTGSGGYKLTCENVSLRLFSTNGGFPNNSWSVDLEDSGANTSELLFLNCDFGIHSNLNALATFPTVKVTHSTQRIRAVGQAVMAAFYTNGAFYTNCILSPFPTAAEDNIASLLGNPINYGYVQATLTNGLPPSLIMITPGGPVRIDGGDKASIAGTNLFTGTNIFSANQTVIGANSVSDNTLMVKGGASSAYGYSDIISRIYGGTQEGGRIRFAWAPDVGDYGGVMVLSANDASADKTPRNLMWLRGDGSITASASLTVSNGFTKSPSFVLTAGVIWTNVSAASPEGLITAPPGSICSVTINSTNNIWCKTNGTGSAGWNPLK